MDMKYRFVKFLNESCKMISDRHYSFSIRKVSCRKKSYHEISMHKNDILIHENNISMHEYEDFASQILMDENSMHEFFWGVGGWNFIFMHGNIVFIHEKFHFHGRKFHFHAWNFHATIFSCMKLFVRVIFSNTCIVYWKDSCKRVRLCKATEAIDGLNQIALQE